MREPNSTTPLANGLTTRQVEIVAMVACGHSTKEITARFGIARGTVSRYLGTIYKRLGVRGRVGLAVWWHKGNGAPPEGGDCSQCLLRAVDLSGYEPDHREKG